MYHRELNSMSETSLTGSKKSEIIKYRHIWFENIDKIQVWKNPMILIGQIQELGKRKIKEKLDIQQFNNRLQQPTF